MIAHFWHWLRGTSPDQYVEYWTPERALKAEREMHTRLGRVSEPHFDWHAKLLARSKRRQAERSVEQFRRRA